MTVSYDPLLDTNADDPYALYRQFRRERPVHYNGERNLWALFLYEDVMATLPDWKRFSNRWQDNDPSIFFESDPPRLAEIRAVIKDPFTPREVQRFEADFRTRAVELLAKRAGSAGFDVMTDFAWPLVIDAVCDMIGIPAGDRPQVTTYLQRIRRDAGDEEANNDLRTFLENLTNDRIAHQREDLVSAMARAPRELVSIHDAVGFSFDILESSVESVSGAIANGVRALADHPDQLQVLRALDSEGVRVAVEEFLRYDSPVRVQPRVAREDVEFQGVRIAAGSQIWLVLGSANRDERAFADPDRLDLRRASTRHVAFGNGIHFCVGAPLTRLAMRVALPLLVDTLPEYDARSVLGSWNASRASRTTFDRSMSTNARVGFGDAATRDRNRELSPTLTESGC